MLTAMEKIALILIIPFIGTTAGSALVFLLKKNMRPSVERALSGFAAGVMVAASIWSLLVPAIAQSADKGRLAFVPAFAGFWIGILFLLFLDRATPHLHVGTNEKEGPQTHLSRTTMMVLAVTLHNIPEEMAVGAVLAGVINGYPGVTMGGAMVLALGIAIQNLPEGAIVSMPLYAEGKKKSRAFLLGTLTGVVEPIFGVLTLVIASQVVPYLPVFLSFAAGAMIYVVVEELIPEMSEGRHSNVGVIAFSIGFSLMMALDVALG